MARTWWIAAMRSLSNAIANRNDEKECNTLRRVSEAEEYEFSTAGHMIKKSRLTSGMIHDIE